MCVRLTFTTDTCSMHLPGLGGYLVMLGCVVQPTIASSNKSSHFIYQPVVTLHCALLGLTQTLKYCISYERFMTNSTPLMFQITSNEIIHQHKQDSLRWRCLATRGIINYVSTLTHPQELRRTSRANYFSIIISPFG